MISYNSLVKIAEIFNGDNNNFYSYKSGPKLVQFFNLNFKYKDIYGSPFPSRWMYTANKLEELQKTNQLEIFFTIILSKKYIMNDLSCNEIDSINKISEILTEINKILEIDGMTLIKNKNNEFKLLSNNENLVFLKAGGFANVYKIKNMGNEKPLVLKKLNEESVLNEHITSRFKREFEITKSLEKNQGIIKVYDFNSNNYSYTMELADMTLEEFFENNPIINEKEKENIIHWILWIMSEVHKKNIFHRDLHPGNIFLVNSQIKIGDFGLGKNLSYFNSHNTENTKSYGRYHYCAPEQLENLKDGDKRSDVYSLGKLINYIFTGSPNNDNHYFKYNVVKATNKEPSKRYLDSEKFLMDYQKTIKFRENEKFENHCLLKMKQGIFDDEIENYIFQLNGSKMCNQLINYSKTNYNTSLYKFMQLDLEHAIFILNFIQNNFEKFKFEEQDQFALFAGFILQDNFDFSIKEQAATILRGIAWETNRFNAQRIIQNIVNKGIDPILENILNNENNL